MTTFFEKRKESDKKIIARIRRCQNMAQFDKIYEEIECLNNGFLERNQGLIEQAQEIIMDREENSLSSQFVF